MTVATRALDVPARDQSFDLLRNPFAILGLSPDATREDVVTAFEDGIADGIEDEKALREARRQLLAPNLRMQATVEFLPDATQADRTEVVAALRERPPLSNVIAVAKKLRGFSLTIFVSQVARLWPSSGMLRSFALSRAQLDREVIADTVRNLLDASGSPQPQIDAINEVIEAVTLRNAENLFVGYVDIKAAAADMTRCLEEELPRAKTEQISVLSLVVDAYVKEAAPRLQAARRKVEDAAEAVRRDPGAPSGTHELISLLSEWDAIAQPQQLLASHKGRDEGGARDLFQFLRGLMLELANERDKPSVALELNKACREVFAELPRAEQQLRDDETALETLADQEKLHELSAFVADAKKNPDALVRDLNQGGFGEFASGRAGRLFEIFNQSLIKAQGTPAAEFVWGFVRVLALEFNNEHGEAVAAQRLIEGLEGHPKFLDAPASLRTALADDLHTMRSNAIHAKLNRAVEKKDRGQAKVHLAELVSVTRDPAERAKYQHTINEIETANNWRILKWVIWGVIALVGIGIAMSQNNRSSSYSLSTPSYTAPAVVPKATFDEVKPPAGTNLSLNRGNIRYCLYQSTRLDAANAMLSAETNDGVIGVFNTQVDDYNLRCGKYKYYTDDMSAVEAEVAAKRNSLTAEGQQLVRTWRARF